MHSSLRPSPAMVIALVSFLVLLGRLAAAVAAEPAEAARCLGHRATIVGSAKNELRIKGTGHKDVIACAGEATTSSTAARGRRIVCERRPGLDGGRRRRLQREADRRPRAAIALRAKWGNDRLVGGSV